MARLFIKKRNVEQAPRLLYNILIILLASCGHTVKNVAAGFSLRLAAAIRAHCRKNYLFDATLVYENVLGGKKYFTEVSSPSSLSR
jgi:hypothetical protein